MNLEPIEELIEDSVINIVVYLKYNNMGMWFVSYRDIWVIDYYLFYGVSENDNWDFSERFNIPVLNSHSAANFIQEMQNNQFSTEELRVNLGDYIKDASSVYDALAYLPSFYVDLDTQVAFSVYSENQTLELYIPDDWTVEYKDFYSKIPTEDKYWIIEGIDLFETKKESGVPPQE